MLPLSRGEIDAAAYRDHLDWFLGFHQPVEERLRRVPGLDRVVSDLDERWKTPRLARDLGGTASGRRAPESCLPALGSIPQALGVMYVLEGATLGARTILPRLGAVAEPGGETGTEYLSGYGADTGRRWRRFRAVLDAVAPGEADAVIESARQTFESLLGWRREWVDGRDHAGGQSRTEALGAVREGG